KYISTVFIEELKIRLQDKGLTEVDVKLVEATDSDQDPRIIEIIYPNVIETPGYIQPRVLVEIGSRSLREPFSICSFSSMLDESFPESPFVQQPIHIPSVRPERTLLEKIFLLHEEFQRPLDKMRVKRLSRHLYDIYQLSKTVYAQNVLSDKALYTTIVNHRHRYAKVDGVDYKKHSPRFINPIPIPEVIEAWKYDYKVMREQMIYGESPSFERMLNQINEFTQQINALDWEVSGDF
ncbi:MAG: nucleotidyl transferase AbiEii/AbiGii toxin family protein, partial [Bacteroidales bacterium]|nr:nucleotidyl transferase AbiEii/AbiGii toxin family protein [Bacteroidales bacterium]